MTTNLWLSTQLAVACSSSTQKTTPDHMACSLLDDDREALLNNFRTLVDRSVLIQNESNDKCSQLPEDTHPGLHSLNRVNPLLIKKSGLGLTEPPEDETWRIVMHMDLANNKLSELPLSPSSPELKVLLLQGNVDLTRIPNAFFFNMPKLSILDLSYTSVRDLPDSLFELEQLRELYLKCCECFMKLSPKIGRLKKLEKLDLDGTHIIHLPKEMEELTNLQGLFLCFYEYRGRKGKQYTSSTIIPSEVISKLKGIKHLSIDVNPDDERWYDNIQDILPEISGLEHLLTLSLYIPHLELLQFIPDRIFQADFRFVVGRHMQRIISSTPSTCKEKFKQSGCSLKFVNGDHVPNEIKRVVRHSKALFVERHKTIKNMSEFEMMNLEQLRVCVLSECREMQTVVDGRQSDKGSDIFSHLLYLYISHMASLKSIWEGWKPRHFCFGMLKSLVLQNCPELTTVFTMDFLGNLSLLKELVVKDCPKITTLISDESFKHKGEIFLPKLRRIMLLHLPELINIASGDCIGPNLNSMAIYDCPKLQSFSKFELSSQNLKVINGEIKWWHQVQWSKEEWGISQRPSKFDCIFSSIDNQDDIMSQLWNDNDIDDDAATIADTTPLQTLFEQNAGITSRMTCSVPRQMSEWKEFTLHDGNRWRKVGHETMAGSKNPSHYYECANVDCPVRKRVQQSEEDPTLIEILCKGIHTHEVQSRIVDEPIRPSNDEVFMNGKRSRKRVVMPRWQTQCILQSTGLESQAESLDDGFSWRKYGQKEILGAKYPRKYYRCTHGNTQGCLAKKHVQRDDKEPFLIHTFYSGRHTCTQTSIVTNPSMNNQVDLSSQSGVVDDDVHYHPASEPLQFSSVTNSSVNNNQADVMTQFGLDDMDDISGKVDEPLRPSNDEDEKHSPKRVIMPRRELQLKGHRPAPLRIHKDSHKIKKPPLAPPHRPVVIYSVSPKVINIPHDDFMSVAQRLTGPLSSSSSSNNDNPSAANHGDMVSPAANEKARSPMPNREIVQSEEGIVEVTDNVIDRPFSMFPGILSPVPAALPPIPASFFSPSLTADPAAVKNQETRIL